MAVERVSAKQYGVRYGRKLRAKVGKIGQSRAASKKCPYCNYDQAKRLAAGIWHCSKCKSKFTGRAYNIGKKYDELEKANSEQDAEAPKQEAEIKKEALT